tara:strand:- start:130 stop:474 length:345 start_codon:yes stop_codon:yes gene_type:complete
MESAVVIDHRMPHGIHSRIKSFDLALEFTCWVTERIGRSHTRCPGFDKKAELEERFNPRPIENVGGGVALVGCRKKETVALELAESFPHWSRGGVELGSQVLNVYFGSWRQASL